MLTIFWNFTRIMPKMPAKYFIAVVPDESIQERVNQVKLEIKDAFNAKYALKSPPHVTLKMPFTWDERREPKLIKTLSGFFAEKAAFELTFHGVGTFRNRVVFIQVEESLPLRNLQEDLTIFCKTKLQLMPELSDQTYHPHMTVAFRDVKPRDFNACVSLVRGKNFFNKSGIDQIALLKRAGRNWQILHLFSLKLELI